MEFINLKTLTLNTFDKNDKNHLKFVKSLCSDLTIKSQFQGITIGLLHNRNLEFFGHGFLVSLEKTLVGYIGISNYHEDEKSVYLRGAISKEKRGCSLGETLLDEVSNYIFENYTDIMSIRLKIDKENRASLMTANACDFKWLKDDIYIKNNPFINYDRKIKE